jgi:hypothetical protein
MKKWESMLAMLLCSGLIVTFGLTACGDDDEEESGMTCEEALATLTSDNCINSIEAALPGIQDCLNGCAPGNEACVDDCLVLDGVLPSSCVQAIDMLMDEDEAVCGACYVNCGQNLVNCLVQGNAPETCLVQLGTCIPTCN